MRGEVTFVLAALRAAGLIDSQGEYEHDVLRHEKATYANGTHDDRNINQKTIR